MRVRFFPEFKEASEWRKSGISILNREIKKQVYPDGGQYELDPHYHLAAINIFCKALRMADVNGFRQEFPAEYVNTVKSMIEFYANICFPDYSNPCFSDAKLGDRPAEILIIRIGSSYFLIVSGFVIMPQKVVKALPCPTFLTVRRLPASLLSETAGSRMLP